MTLGKLLLVLTFLAGAHSSVTAGESPAYWEAVDRTAAKYEDPGLIPEESIRWLASEYELAPDKVFLHLIQGRPGGTEETRHFGAAPMTAAAPMTGAAPMMSPRDTRIVDDESDRDSGTSIAQRVQARRALREAELQDEYAHRRPARRDHRSSPRAEREARRDSRRSAQREARRAARERLQRDRAAAQSRARNRAAAQDRTRDRAAAAAETRARGDRQTQERGRYPLASSRALAPEPAGMDSTDYAADLRNLLRKYGTVGRTPIRPIESLAARQNKTPLDVLRDLMRTSKQMRY